MENKISSSQEKDSDSPFKDFRAAHYSIRTTEYSELIKWYQEKLEFRLTKEWTSGEMKLAFLSLPNDNNFSLEILGVSDGLDKNLPDKAGYDHICFNVENLDATIDELRKRDIKIVRNFSAPAIGKRVAFISDTFGNKIEFCEDLRRQ